MYKGKIIETSMRILPKKKSELLKSYKDYRNKYMFNNNIYTFDRELIIGEPSWTIS